MRLTNTGFSLIAVIIAISAVSGIALVLTNLNKQKTQIQQKVKVHFEIENVSQRILRTLFDSRSCTYTLGHGSTIVNGRNILSIKNSNGGAMFTTTKKYGNEAFMFESFTLDKANIINKSDSTVDLKVVFKKTDDTVKGYDRITKNFPLILDLDSSRKLVKCYSNHQLIMNLVTSSSCNQVGGSFHPETGKCIPAALSMASQSFCEGIGATFSKNRCNLESLRLKILKSMCRNLGGNYQSSIKECILPPTP